MSAASHWRDVLAEVEAVRCCSRPIRMRGIILEQGTGALIEGSMLVPCKDRRAAVCPSCSRLYQDDAWQLVAAGLRGGKGVSAEVLEHPQLFVTLTAPSFGPVHSGARAGTPPRPCRPRREGGNCEHGLLLSCGIRHGTDDPRLGEPLCPECFDYRGAVLWNAHVPRLWERTSSELYRSVARARSMSTKELRGVVRLSYMKVVEFQRRGLVHLHVVVRADGAAGPSEFGPEWLDATVLASCITAAIARASVALPSISTEVSSRAVWGRELDVRALVADGGQDSGAIAAYVAKYATKTADGSSLLAYPIRRTSQLERLVVRAHVARLVRTTWKLGSLRELRHLNLRAHAHTLGYTGQFSSKSLRFSTTFSALREARVLHAKGGVLSEPDFDGEWHYAGRGYDHPESDGLADSLFEVSCKVRQNSTVTSTPNSTTP